MEIDTWIRAPPERCFDLARSLDLHAWIERGKGERAIAGRTSGLIELGEGVTWRARHLGVTWTLGTRITALDRPRSFVDEMEKGPFRRFHHEHVFLPRDGGTLMRDRMEVEAPWGLLGRAADRLFLAAYMRRLLAHRAREIKRVAESEEWWAFVPGP